MKSPEKYKMINLYEKQSLILLNNINNKYELKLSIIDNFNTHMRRSEFILVDNENDKEIKLPKTINSLLQPLYFEYSMYGYFIEYNSEEYIRIQLGINMIKSLYNII